MKALDSCSRVLANQLVLASVLLLSAAAAEAATMFEWNADTVATSIGNCAKLVGALDQVQRHSGVASMRMTIQGNVQTTLGCEVPRAIDLISGANGEWLYYRWWMKIDSVYSWGAANAKWKSNRVKQRAEVLPSPYTMYVWKSGVYVGECAECRRGTSTADDPSDARVSYNFDPRTNPAVTGWQEYIVGIKRQTCRTCTDGEFHFWVNGAEIGQGVKGMQYCSSLCDTWVEAWGANLVGIYPQLNDASAGGVIWVDEVSLATDWNSTETSRPQAPTDVVVN